MYPKFSWWLFKQNPFEEKVGSAAAASVSLCGETKNRSISKVHYNLMGGKKDKENGGGGDFHPFEGIERRDEPR
jgi:hypothetical protein